MWTVEWIHSDGSRDVTGRDSGVFDTTPLSIAYHALLEGKSKKRKRRSPDPEKREPRPVSKIDESVQYGVQRRPEATTSSIEDPSQTTSTPDQTGKLMEENQSIPGLPEDPYTDTSVKPKPNNPPEQASTLLTGPRPPEAHSYHFYLVKPHTSSARPVLIPVSGSDNLSECLQEQVVLEFPTIQVLPGPPSSLPNRFMLESDYLAQFRAEALELDELLAQVKQPLQDDGGHAGADGGGGVPQDLKMVAEMLQKDVGGGR